MYCTVCIALNVLHCVLHCMYFTVSTALFIERNKKLSGKKSSGKKYMFVSVFSLTAADDMANKSTNQSIKQFINLSMLTGMMIPRSFKKRMM